MLHSGRSNRSSPMAAPCGSFSAVSRSVSCLHLGRQAEGAAASGRSMSTSGTHAMIASKQGRSRYSSVQQMKFHFLLEHCCHGNLSSYEGHESVVHTLHAEACNLVCLSGWPGHFSLHAALSECALKILSSTVARYVGRCVLSASYQRMGMTQSRHRCNRCS